MIYKTKAARPYRRRDGTWDVKTIETEIEIPDENLNRHSIFCAACTWGNGKYPECRKTCPSGDLNKKELQ